MLRGNHSLCHSSLSFFSGGKWSPKRRTKKELRDSTDSNPDFLSLSSSSQDPYLTMWGMKIESFKGCDIRGPGDMHR